MTQGQDDGFADIYIKGENVLKKEVDFALNIFGKKFINNETLQEWKETN